MVCVMFIDENGAVCYCSEPLAWAKSEDGVVRFQGGEITPGEGVSVQIVEAELAEKPEARGYALLSERIPGGMRVRPVEIQKSPKTFEGEMKNGQ